jgi:hypothetical protein
MSSAPKPNGPAPSARTIDLFWAGVERDGSPIYASPLEALMSRVGLGITWLVMKYPNQTGQGLVLGSVAGACVYLAWDAVKHESARARKSSHGRFVR